jgi:hypothetical protein
MVTIMVRAFSEIKDRLLRANGIMNCQMAPPPL